MKSVNFPIAIAAAVAAALSMPASAADPATSRVTAVPANTAPATRLASQRAPGNGGTRRVGPAASAASGTRNGDEVQTTVEDGRTTTLNANMPNSKSVGSTPKN
jgi:hypothetical protein